MTGSAQSPAATHYERPHNEYTKNGIERDQRHTSAGIKQIGAGGETVRYQILLETDSAELDAIDKLSLDDLAAINGELTRLGQAPVPLPPPPDAP